MLKDFYKATTKKFDVTISYNGVYPDITNDTVRIEFKKEKNGAVLLSKDADVTTSGAGGKAKFNLSKAETDIEACRYYYFIIWDTTIATIDEEHIVETENVNIMSR